MYNNSMQRLLYIARAGQLLLRKAATRRERQKRHDCRLLQQTVFYVLQQGLGYLMSVYGASLGTGHDTMNMVPWNLLSAASILVTIPIIVIFFFAQKQFIEGVRFTGLKG